MTDILLGTAMRNACPRPDWDGRQFLTGRPVRCDLIFGAAQVPASPAPPVEPENWLYRRLREASEMVAKWSPERRANINYTPLGERDGE